MLKYNSLDYLVTNIYRGTLYIDWNWKIINALATEVLVLLLNNLGSILHLTDVILPNTSDLFMFHIMCGSDMKHLLSWCLLLWLLYKFEVFKLFNILATAMDMILVISILKFIITVLWLNIMNLYLYLFNKLVITSCYAFINEVRCSIYLLF